MRANRTKAKLAAGGLALGAALPIPSPELVEVSAVCGFDFVTIDAEHEAMGDEQITHMIRSAEAFGVTPIVRLARDPDRILRYLTAGAQGIHVPRCNSAEDLRELADATRFFPQGTRTFYALGRSAYYSAGVEDRQWAEAVNRELLVIAMIEEAEALTNLTEILAVPYVDAIHIGPKDLWQSLGMPEPGVVEEKVAEITLAAVAAGKHVSLSLRLTDDIQGRIAGHLSRGARMISVYPVDFILRGAGSLLRQIQGMVPGDGQTEGGKATG